MPNMSELLENRYRIIRELAEGGFGKTFIAEDTQMPSHRRCVIKELKPLNEGSQIYELIKDRFHREAVILEDLGNNNNQIPSLYAHFSSEDKFYLVQEYIEGETLAEKVQKQGKLSEATVKEILSKLLRVLDFIHSKKIIHRDIKPENIILRSGDDTPILIDFGAVREIMGTVISPSGNSTSSIVIGTPGYMPSEQLAGRPIFSSDLYALALTMIYALTSKIPSELPTDPLTGKIGWLQDAFVSPTMANVLDQAIALYPQERFATAGMMLQALQGITAASTILLDNSIDNQPTPPAVPPTVVIPQEDKVIASNKPASNNNFTTVIIALLVLIGFGSLGFFMYQQNQILKTTLNNQKDKEKIEEATKKEETQEAISNKNTEINSEDISHLQNLSSHTTINNISPIGWIRLGAVNNLSGIARQGERFIETTQPVSIAPLIVPNIGDEVTTITMINLRDDVPKAPYYELTQKLSTLTAGQKLIILRIESFVDPTVSNNYTIVWAEVGLP